MGLDNPLHIAFLLVVLLMVFGAKRLPEMGKSIGHGLRGFKDAVSTEAPAPALGVGEPSHPAVAPVAERTTERAAA
jgi:sec-independent protein translocase protein TatA